MGEVASPTEIEGVGKFLAVPVVEVFLVSIKVALTLQLFVRMV
jgi:hypothetical protein